MKARSKLIGLGIAAALAVGIGTYAVTASAHDTNGPGYSYGMMGGFGSGYGPGFGHMRGWGNHGPGIMGGYGLGYAPGYGLGMMGPGWYGN